LRFSAQSRTLEPAELYDWKASDHLVKVTGSYLNRSWEGLPMFLLHEKLNNTLAPSSTPPSNQAYSPARGTYSKVTLHIWQAHRIPS
jgi:hypothetical protein